MVNGEKESSRSVEEEMRADSLAVDGVGVASANWDQGASFGGVEGAQGWGISPPAPWKGLCSWEVLQGGHRKGRQGVSCV